MKNKNRVPAIKLNDQAALDYTLYMMMTGFFKETKCVSYALEEKLLHCYHDQTPVEREVMESICADAVDHYLPAVLPEYIQNCRVQVKLQRQSKDSVTTLVFDGGFFVLEISARINGARRVLISYTFKEEDSAPLSGEETIRYKV